jgi:hypothetical protein
MSYFQMRTIHTSLTFKTISSHYTGYSLYVDNVTKIYDSLFLYPRNEVVGGNTGFTMSVRL